MPATLTRLHWLQDTFGPHAATAELAQWTGERLLQAVVLLQAVQDLRAYPRDHPLYRDALGWFEAASDEPFGSGYACDLLHLDRSAVLASCAHAAHTQQHPRLRRWHATRAA